MRQRCPKCESDALGERSFSFDGARTTLTTKRQYCLNCGWEAVSVPLHAAISREESR